MSKNNSLMHYRQRIGVFDSNRYNRHHKEQMLFKKQKPADDKDQFLTSFYSLPADINSPLFSPIKINNGPQFFLFMMALMSMVTPVMATNDNDLEFSSANIADSSRSVSSMHEVEILPTATEIPIIVTSKADHSLPSVFKSLVEQGRLQHSPLISFNKCRQEVSKSLTSVVKDFPEEEPSLIKILQDPAFSVNCMKLSEYNKQSAVHAKSKLAILMGRVNKSMTLPFPIPPAGKIPLESHWLKHEFRHAYVYARNKATPCATLGGEEEVAAPIYPYDKPNKNLFYKNLEAGLRRICDFFKLQKKSILSREETIRLKTYQAAAAHIHSLNFIYDKPSGEVYEQLKSYKIGEKYPNLSPDLSITTFELKFEERPGQFISTKIKARFVHLYLENNFPKIVLKFLNPHDHLFALLSNFANIKRKYAGHPSPVRMAELDAYVRQHLPKQTFMTFFPELDSYDQALDARCFPPEENASKTVFTP